MRSRQAPALVCLLMLTACSGSAAKRLVAPTSAAIFVPATFTLSGSVKIVRPFSITDADPTVGADCYGYLNPDYPIQHDYSSVKNGGTVTAQGNTVQDGTVAQGVLIGGTLMKTDFDTRECDFQFNVVNVPRGKKFYSLIIGDVQTGQVSEADAVAGSREITFGDN